MAAAYLITFREGLEAALIVGILLSCLRALNMNRQQIYVWAGVALGLVLSLIFAWVFATFVGGFEGKTEKIYEGVLMLGAGALITHLVFWMRHKGKEIQAHLDAQVKESVQKGMLWMVALIAAMSVVREGVETVIFFNALTVQAESIAPFISGGAGVLTAVVLTVFIFWSTKNVPVGAFFKYTSYFLLLIAAGLVGHGIVELQGAAWLPTYVKDLYDISAILPETQGGGALLKAGFGYDAEPSLLAVIGYWLYLAVMGVLMFKSSK